MKTNKIRIMLTALCMLFGLSVSAYDFTVDGIYYDIVNIQDLTCKVVSGDTKYSGDVVIPSEVTYNGKTLAVVEIGFWAFKGCEGLTGVTIGNSVTKIEYGAFSGCTGLTGVTIPNSVTKIEGSAFEGCTGLTGVTIPNSVTKIEGSTFEGCTGLTGVTIPNSVTTIGNSVFDGCSGLKTLVIEDGADELSLGNSSQGINKGLFYDCILETLYLGRNLSYNYSPFERQYNLKEVTIGNSVTTIGNYVFDYCSGLKTLVIEDGADKLSLGNSYHGSYEEGLFYNCSLETLYLGRDLSYNDSPFKHQYNLKEVTIGNSVTTIGGNAFLGCKGLTGVTIPNSVTTIGDYAFYDCTGLIGVTIPNSVTMIGYSAFEGCTDLTTIYSMNTVPPTYKSGFGNKCYLNATLYVPTGSLEAYQETEPWKNFWTITEFDPVTGIENVTVDSGAGENGEMRIYDLQGRGLSAPQRGINIINRRKVLVK